MPKKLETPKFCKYCSVNYCVKDSHNNWRTRCDSLTCIETAKNAKVHFKGKKRPEHGIKVRAALTGRPKTIEHKKNMKVNTDLYKKKMLENKNISYTDNNFHDLWTKLISDLRRTESYKWNCVKNWFELDDVDKPNIDLDLMFHKFQSEKSIKAVQSNPRMGNGTRVSLKGLNFCLNGSSITVRSLWESRFVTDFLEKFQIPYSYEVVRFDGYVPDFLLHLPDGSKMIVEIKGTVFDDKIDSIINGCQQSIKAGYRFAFIQKGYFKQWKLEDIFQYERTTLEVNDLKNIYHRSKND